LHYDYTIKWSGKGEMKKSLNTVFIGSYVPRKCGIATFTNDLYNAIVAESKSNGHRVIAMNNIPEGYNYPEEVAFEIQRNHLPDYQHAADFINLSNTDIVSLQHEFGLYGGLAGDYLFSFMSRVKKPIITTLHTIIREPTPDYRRSMEELIRYSHKLVVMTEMSREILKDVYGVPEEQIELTYHGVPDVPFVDDNRYKKLRYLDGRLVILTFGLLNPGKGIEVLLDALVPVVEKYPDIIYIILGATHPEVKKSQGEKYRLFLERKVQDMGLENNVIFHNRYVTLDELCDYILASDIYVSPYLNREQIVSGALTYAIGMGKAIISTPYWHAQEILSDGRGLLVDFGDVEALSQALFSLISDPATCQQMRKKAYEFGRQMIWKEVGRHYLKLFEDVFEPWEMDMAENRRESPTFFHATLPEIKLNHLYLLSDDVGIFQHAKFGIPDRNHGYSTDDVGRGLAVLTNDQIPNQDILPLITTYLSFLHHSQTENGHFHNFMNYDRRFMDEQGSEDTLGRAIFGLGHVVRWGPTEGIRAMAHSIIEKSEPILENLNAPRAKAYAICGLCVALKRYEERQYNDTGQIKRILIKLSDELIALYNVNRTEDWNWFEPIVAYGNAKICDALLCAFQTIHDPIYKEVGLTTLEYLTDIQWNGTFFDLVGNEGWHINNKEKAVFGQQPIDAGYLTNAYVTAYEITGDKRYLHHAYHAFEWFLGRNRLGIPLYDFGTGTVADGLDSHGVNANQGAESIVCFLLALLSLNRY
jgi:glycosyltransferase involved in cell wall biosynthesis